MPATPTLTEIRIGVHAAFTRLVIDLTAEADWTIDMDLDRGVRLVIPGTAIGRTWDMEGRGLVRRVRAEQRATGVDVGIECVPGTTVRGYALTGPHRLVVDLRRAEQASPGLARGAPPPAAGKTGDQRPAATEPAADRIASVAPAGEDLRPPSVSEVGRTGGPTVDTPPAGSPLPASVDPAAQSSDPAPRAQGGVAVPKSHDARPAARLTVVLDPGHGGHDTGALGPHGLPEKQIVLDLALRLAPLLRSRLGLRVLLTRTEDVFVALPDRTALANRAKADFFISLHLNGADTRGVAGVETFFFTREPSDGDARASAQRENLVLDLPGSPGGSQEALLRTTLADMAVSRDMKESSRLAESILGALEGVLSGQNRGVKSGPFYVLATAAMPAVLVESAFITNPREERKLRSEVHRQRIAEALFDGISRYKARYERRLGMSARTPPAGS